MNLYLSVLFKYHHYYLFIVIGTDWFFLYFYLVGLLQCEKDLGLMQNKLRYVIESLVIIFDWFFFFQKMWILIGWIILIRSPKTAIQIVLTRNENWRRQKDNISNCGSLQIKICSWLRLWWFMMLKRRLCMNENDTCKLYWYSRVLKYTCD